LCRAQSACERGARGSEEGHCEKGACSPQAARVDWAKLLSIDKCHLICQHERWAMQGPRDCRWRHQKIDDARPRNCSASRGSAQTSTTRFPRDPANHRRVSLLFDEYRFGLCGIEKCSQDLGISIYSSIDHSSRPLLSHHSSPAIPSQSELSLHASSAGFPSSYC
jgi:hypothetical protein